MLVKVYENELDMEQYINVKDIKKYFVKLDKNNRNFFTLKIETYDKDYYDLAWMITRDCYRYIMRRIAISIDIDDYFLDIFEFQNYYEDNTFYNFYNDNLDKFDEEDKTILEKIFEETTELEEVDNLKLGVIASKILNKEEFKIYEKLKETYLKNIKDKDKLLSEYLK